MSASLSVAMGRSATHRGKIGAGCARIIWKAGMKSSNPAIGDTTGSRQQAADAEQKQNDAERTGMEMVHQPSQRHLTGRGIVYQACKDNGG